MATEGISACQVREHSTEACPNCFRNEAYRIVEESKSSMVASGLLPFLIGIGRLCIWRELLEWRRYFVFELFGIELEMHHGSFEESASYTVIQDGLCNGIVYCPKVALLLLFNAVKYSTRL